MWLAPLPARSGERGTRPLALSLDSSVVLSSGHYEQGVTCASTWSATGTDSDVDDDDAGAELVDNPRALASC